MQKRSSARPVVDERCCRFGECFFWWRKGGEKKKTSLEDCMKFLFFSPEAKV